MFPPPSPSTIAASLLNPRSAASEAASYLSLLRACGQARSLSFTRKIQLLLSLHGLDSFRIFSQGLLAALCKCGASPQCFMLFNKLCTRSVFAWTAILSCYVDSGLPKEAISVYKKMLGDGVEPDSYTYVALFKACGLLRDLEEGRILHAEARSRGFCSDLFIGNTLISMYGKCGSLPDCETMFLEMRSRDLVSCNALLAAYVDQGLSEKALLLYRQICKEEDELHRQICKEEEEELYRQVCKEEEEDQAQHLGFSVDEHSFVFALRAAQMYAECMQSAHDPKIASLEMILALHADARKKGFACNRFIGNTLINVYADCGSMPQATNAYRGISSPDVSSWTALLSAFYEQREPEKALQLYIELPQDELVPNHQALLIALQACGSLAEAEDSVSVDGRLCKLTCLSMGRAIHADALALGLDSSLYVANTLISMYGKCGSVVDAAEVFSGLTDDVDVVTWNAMLCACVEQGEARSALRLYRRMEEEKVSPNRQTFMAVVEACGEFAAKQEEEGCSGSRARCLGIGQALHAGARRRKLASDAFVGTALIRMYGKCGSVAEAENAFNGLAVHDTVSCTALLSSYANQGEDEKVMLLYSWMETQGSGRVGLDDVMLVHVLLACRGSGTMEVCRRVHFAAVCAGLEASAAGGGSVLGNTLVHANGGLASLPDAKAILEGLAVPETTAWNACMAGYASVGSSWEALALLREMRRCRVSPDLSTLGSLLSACNRDGAVDLGTRCFASMMRWSFSGGSKDPDNSLDHFVVLVDLLGRAGDFRRARNALQRAPGVDAASLACLCLVSAARSHADWGSASFAFARILGTRCADAAAYVLLSNLCADPCAL